MSESPTAADRPLVAVIDDDEDMLSWLRVMLERHGYEARLAQRFVPDEASGVMRAASVVLLDWNLEGKDGIDLIARLHDADPDGVHPPIVLMTGHSTVELAARALAAGAYDFLAKPINEARLVTTLSKAVAHHGMASRLAALERSDLESGFEDMVGASAVMQQVFRRIRGVAPTQANVLITGESGTGKELVARAIHTRSTRADHPFVAVNMGAVPRDLLESQFFGHERGAFTGADRRRVGAIEEAAGGTLFLDEVGELPIELQPKLLRFLQERTFRRVGGDQELSSDVRIIAATNRDPEGEVREGRMRQDLYYRLSVVPISMPPLRERGRDAALLARHFVRAAAERHSRNFVGIDSQAEDMLTAAPWPGNVRQLQHLVEQVVVLNEGPLITPGMLPPDLLRVSGPGSAPPLPSAGAGTAGGPPESAASIERNHSPAPAGPTSNGGMVTPSGDEVVPLADLEREAILRAVRLCGGSASEAAHRLGIGEATIYRKLRKYREQGGSPESRTAVDA